MIFDSIYANDLLPSSEIPWIVLPHSRTALHRIINHFECGEMRAGEGMVATGEAYLVGQLPGTPKHACIAEDLKDIK
jgi:hypothetical protein